MDVLTAISDRRAIRAYKDEAVDRKLVERLIEAAVSAPSSRDLEPWAFVVFEGREKLRGFSGEAKRELLASPELEASPDVRALLADPSFNMFYGAPVLTVIAATSPGSQASEDCCLAAQNFMLAAYSFGLGTCPIGFARHWLCLTETKRRIGIPENVVPVFPVIVGHPAEAPSRRGRRPPVVLWR